MRFFWFWKDELFSGNKTSSGFNFLNAEDIAILKMPRRKEKNPHLNVMKTNIQHRI